MRQLLSSLLLMLFITAASAQIQTTTTDSASLAQEIANTVFGGCVQISNITWSGHVHAFGTFSDPNEFTGMSNGLVMSTGHVDSLLVTDSGEESTDFYTDGDSALQVIGGGITTYNAAVLEFDFTPISDTLFATQFIFGSEEYPEWVNSGYNDVFAFWISGGPNGLGPTNVALIPGTNTPVSIDNINAGLNSAYYVDNTSGTELGLDGLTTLIPIEYPVAEGGSYHFRIGITDVGDGVWDSAILMRSQSFCGNFWFQTSEFVMTNQGGLTYEFENHSTRSTSYLWDFGDGTTSTLENPVHTYAQSGNYLVSLTAYNSCQSTENQQQLNMMVTDIEDVETTDLSVYTTDQGRLVVSYEGSGTAPLRYEILNNLGQMVDSGNLGLSNSYHSSIPLSHSQSGVFYFRLWVGNSPLVKPFVHLVNR